MHWRIGFVALALACNGSPGVPKTITVRARGLYLSPSDPQTPDGALSRADNVVISRDGIVETRRGQEPVASSSVRRLAAYKGALIGHDGTSTLSRSSDSGATWTSYTQPVTPPSGEPLRTAEMASSLFLTDSTGVKRIDALTATPETAGVPAGLDVDLTLSSAGSPTAMPNNKRLAYRVLFGKRDANERLILGAPSGRATITNTSGATRDVAVNISIPRGVDSSHFYQVYRSIASVDQNTDPGDELGLVAEGTLPQNAAVTQLVRASNVVTATTAAAHGYATGQIVRVSPGGALSSHAVAVGSSSAVSRTTDDGVTWSNAGISGLSGTFRAVASSGALYAAVGDSGAAATSPDGLTWTPRTTTAFPLNGLVWTGSLFVAVGAPNIVYTSPDGITWTARSGPPTTVTFRGVTWNGSVLVAVGNTVTGTAAAAVATSPDGISWTNRTVSAAGGTIFRSVAWSGSVFAAVGDSLCYTSPDGVTWTSRTISAGTYRSIVWTGTQFVAVGSSSSCATSPDGITWTARTITAGSYEGVAVSGANIVAVGNGVAATSPDGVTWTPRTIGAGSFTAIASGGGATFSPGEKTITGTPTSTTFAYAETGTDGTLAVAQTAEPLTAAILDTVPDGFLGASLYTNANQEGILNANERPPVAKDLAEFKRSLFFAGITTPAYGTAYLLAVGGANGLQSGDTVTVNGLTYTGAASESISAREFKVTTSGSVSQNIRDTAASLVRVVNRSLTSGATVTDISDPEGVPGYLAFRATDASSSLTVTFSRTTAWSPAAGISESPKTYANGFVWSKPDQPDSVPTAQILLPTLIGSADKRILRVIPTRSSLFFLKEDGVWRLTGQNGEWDVQPFDPTIRVVAPETAVVLDNTIWALSEQGEVRISDTGTSVTSRPIESALLAAIGPSLKSTTIARAFAVGYESDRKLLLWLPEAGGDTLSTHAYVYDHFTQAWTRRTDNASHALVNPADDLLYTVDGTNVTRERKTLTDADLQDGTGTAISTAVTWSPKFGGSPFGLHEFQEVNILWDRARFTTATVGFATNLSQTPENVTLNGSDYACNASAVTDLRVNVWPPSEKTWGSQLSVTVSHAEAGSPNAIAGLEVTFVPGGGAASR